MLISIYLAEGNIHDARKHYYRVTAMLRDELGVAPSVGLSSLERKLECTPPARYAVRLAR